MTIKSIQLNNLEVVKKRLLSKVKVDDNGCWIWQGELHNDYGRFYYQDKKWRAHRVSYEVFKESIPEGLFVCHSCDVRACINPEHLWVGTHQENMEDAFRKGRIFKRPEQPPKPRKQRKGKLNKEQVLEIKRLYATGEWTQKKIAEKFGVCRSNITLIINGYNWKES